MTKIKDIVDYLLNLYPLYLASNFDEGKVGLQFGSQNHVVKKVMIALDGTNEVIDEAILNDIDLIILHHPFMFSPMISLNYDNPLQKKYLKVIQNNLNVFAMHTNFDVAKNGMNEVLLQMLGVKTILNESEEVKKDCFLRYGKINRISLASLIDNVKNTFHLSCVRYVGNLDQMVDTIGIVGGSGGSELYLAKRLGCDAFITGEIKHNQANDALDLGVALIEVPHAIEGFFKQFVLENLAKAFPDVQFIASSKDTNPFKVK